MVESPAVRPDSRGIVGVLDDAKADAVPSGDAKGAGDGAGAKEPHAEASPEVDESKATSAGAKAAAPGAPPLDPPSSGLVPAQFFWAEPRRGKAVVDVIDAFNPSLDAEDPLLRLTAAHPMADGIDEVLPEDATLPDGFTRGDRWVVITTDGEARGQAVAFGASSGASEVHLMVVLDVDARGLAVRVGDWKGSAAALRPAEAVDLSRGAGKTLLEAIGPGFVDAATSKAAKVLRRRPPGPTSVRVVPGRFPGGFAYLVSLAQKQRPGADVFEEHVSALALADATGRLKMIIPPDLSIDSYEVSYLVDLDADGHDEFVWRSSYYEGSYTMLSLWDRTGRLVERVLTGDGA